jgi:hypothetical protein
MINLDSKLKKTATVILSLLALFFCIFPSPILTEDSKEQLASKAEIVTQRGVVYYHTVILSSYLRKSPASPINSGARERCIPTPLWVTPNLSKPVKSGAGEAFQKNPLYIIYIIYIYNIYIRDKNIINKGKNFSHPFFSKENRQPTPPSSTSLGESAKRRDHRPLHLGANAKIKSPAAYKKINDIRVAAIERAMAVKICIVCKRPFKPDRTEHTCCSDECREAYADGKKRDQKWCAACGEFYTPDEARQVYCGKRCKDNAQTSLFSPKKPPKKPKTLVDKLAESKKKARKWSLVAPEAWSMQQYWAWLCFSFDKKGITALGFRDFTEKDWGQLKRIQSSRHVEMSDLRDVTSKVVNNFQLFQDRFKWVGPLTPGQLLGFWDSIVDFTKGEAAAALRQYNPDEDDWSGSDSSVKNYDDWFQPDTSGKDYDEWFDDEKSEKITGKIKVSDWRNLPREKWVATTVWSYVKDLLSPQLRVVPLSTEKRRALTELLETAGVDLVFLVCQAVCTNYQVFKDRFRWNGAVHPGMIISFWDGLITYAEKMQLLIKPQERRTFNDGDDWEQV